MALLRDRIEAGRAAKAQEAEESFSAEKPTREKILLLINPKAGRGRAVDILGDYISILAADGSPVTIYFTQSAEDLTRYVMQAGDSYDRVIAAGGDGTLNELVTGYIDGGLSTELAYLPTGTTCDFASTLGIPSDISEAAETARKGESSLLDVGVIDERKYFVYVASFGAFAETSYDTPTELKNNIGRLAYEIGRASCRERV